MATIEYYQDEEQHGNYQYVSVREIIDGLILEIQGDPDHYLFGLDHSILLKHAFNGVKELNFKGQGKRAGLELSIGSDLKYILPQDYVDYLRVSLVDNRGYVIPLDYNRSINTSKSFIQDHNYDIVFDSDGFAIEIDGHNAEAIPYQTYTVGSTDVRGDICYSASVNIDTSKLSKNGEFKIDKELGIIYFSSELYGANILLEYISDGLEGRNLNQETVKVHKYARAAIEDYTYAESIARRKNVPANEKLRARNRYKTSLHEATVFGMKIDPVRINRAWRSAFKPVKI